jgi:hypothetical protein
VACILGKKIAVAVAFVAAIGLAITRTLPPAALPADAPADEFSAGRAVETVRAISGAPRTMGSPAYEGARDYLVARLSALGLATEVQRTTLNGVKVENPGPDGWNRTG